MRSHRFASLAVLLFALACASSGPRPGVGDISFRLSWEGVADLDLYVVSPLGERLSFIRRSVGSGGLLDIDCNVRPDPPRQPEGDDSWVCLDPLENVFWPKGEAPHGVYRYWMVLAYPEGLRPTDEYRLEVRLGRQVVRAHPGRVADLMDGQLSYEIEFE